MLSYRFSVGNDTGLSPSKLSVIEGLGCFFVYGMGPGCLGQDFEFRSKAVGGEARI